MLGGREIYIETHHAVTIICFYTETNNLEHGGLTNIAHNGDVSGFLRFIVLINADAVNPHTKGNREDGPALV
jgi:hypothetical protein